MDSTAPRLPNPYNPKPASVTDAFGFNPSGYPETIGSVTLPPNLGHVQGFAPWGDYYVATHSRPTESKGWVIVLNFRTMVRHFDTLHDSHNHPGGLQIIGDYVVIPVDKEAAKETPHQHSHDTYVDFYVCSKSGPDVNVDPLSYSLHLPNGEGACAGITNYTSSSGEERYLLCVFGDGKYKFYRSNVDNLGDPNLLFTPCGAPDNPGHGAAGMALMTEDGTQDIYLTTLWSNAETSTYSDYATLFQVQFEDGVDSTVESIKPIVSEKHCFTSGGPAGFFGVHFEWGTGVTLTSDSMSVYATQRNMMGAFAFDLFK